MNVMQKRHVKIHPISAFGTAWLQGRDRRWLVHTITDHVLFSKHPGPWILLEQDHFQRWISLSNDPHFRVSWSGWQ